jgi:hypothetical protein
MASKTPIALFKITPELKAIAKEIKTLTVLYAPTSENSIGKKTKRIKYSNAKTRRGWTGPGNLKRKIGSYNTYDNMIQFNEKGKATITVDYAPPGAEYGEFWNEPFRIVSHRPEYNFAEKAANDPKVNALIDAYILSLQNQVVNNIQANLPGK